MFFSLSDLLVFLRQFIAYAELSLPCRVDEYCEYMYQGLCRKAITFQIFLSSHGFLSLFQEQKPENNQDYAAEPEGDDR
jgi:hypothetical protein